jgi:hypothetical protein
METEQRRQRSALLVAVRQSVSELASQARRALGCVGCVDADGHDVAALCTRLSAVASDPEQLYAAGSALNAAAASTGASIRRLAEALAASMGAGDAAGEALLTAGRTLAAGVAHLAAMAKATAAEAAAGSSVIWQGAATAADKLAPLAAVLAQQRVEGTELLAAASRALELAGQPGGGDAFDFDCSSLAGLAACAAQWPAAVQVLSSVRTFLLRLLVSSVRCAALGRPNDKDLAAMSARVPNLLAADVDADPALAGLLTAPRHELLSVVTGCCEQLPHMLAALRSVRLAAAHGYAGNPAVTAAEAQAQAERLAGPFLQPAFCATRLAATLLAAADGVLTVAAHQQGDVRPDGASGSELVTSLTAALRAFLGIGGMTPQRFLEGAAAAATAKAAPPAIEQLEAALVALGQACVAHGPRQATGSATASEKSGLAELSSQIFLMSNIQLRTLFVAGVDAEVARFSSKADAASNGEHDVCCWVLVKPRRVCTNLC